MKSSKSKVSRVDTIVVLRVGIIAPIKVDSNRRNLEIELEAIMTAKLRTLGFLFVTVGIEDFFDELGENRL